jgi:hypothetical protein
MSLYTPEDARWLYNLFSRLAFYWDLYMRDLRNLDFRKWIELVVAGLTSGGCSLVRAVQYYGQLFWCGSSYVAVGATYNCNDFRERNLDLTESLAVGIRDSNKRITLCTDRLTYKVSNCQVVFKQLLLSGVLSDGSFYISPSLWIHGCGLTESLEIGGFQLVVTPTEIGWKFKVLDVVDYLERLGLDIPQLISPLLNDPNGKALVEKGITNLAEVLRKTLRTTTTYLLY